MSGAGEYVLLAGSFDSGIAEYLVEKALGRRVQQKTVSLYQMFGFPAILLYFNVATGIADGDRESVGSASALNTVTRLHHTREWWVM